LAVRCRSCSRLLLLALVALWLGAQQQPAAVPGDEVDDSSLVAALALALNQVAVDATLKTVLVTWKNVKAEALQSSKVVFADCRGE
jgi:hypothetical protein